jgi:hypothetical protein
MKVNSPSQAGAAPNWASMGSRIEYWFFSTRWARSGLLVDFIRLPGNIAEVRASWLDDGNAVAHRAVGAFQTAGPSSMTASDCSLGPYGWTGSVGPVAWDLRWGDSEITVTVPRRPLRHIKVLDVALSSYPRLRVSGSVHFAGQVRQLNELPGMRCHYWGRALPRRWTWLSANEFDVAETAVEIGSIQIRPVGQTLPVTSYWLCMDARRRVMPG